MSRYEIRLAAQLDAGWGSWFEGFTLTQGVEGSTVLTGAVVDQAALHGVLRRVGDLGVVLLSITLLRDDDVDRPCPHPLPTGTHRDRERRSAGAGTTPAPDGTAAGVCRRYWWSWPVR
ncbi:hypothetical protein ACX80H_00045 [Arthrobacter sp. MDT2-2]